MRNWLILTVKPKAPALPISISSLDNEHSDDLAYVLPQHVGEVEIAHSFREANDSDASLGETNMVKFKNLS